MQIKKQQSSQEVQTPSRNTPLYQQLYVPTLGGPNPNLLNLDKIMKKYSKLSKTMTSLNLCIGFLLTLSICEKVYYLTEYFVHTCTVFEHFVLISLVGNIVWLISSFMIIFGHKKKSKNVIKVYLFLMFLCLFVFGSSLLLLKFSAEQCDLKTTNMTISLIFNGFEILVIFVLFWSEVYMLKLLKHITSLRDSYLNDNIADVK